MKSHFIFLFVLWFFSAAALCQNRTIDSLQQLVKNEKEDAAKGPIYAEIGFEYFVGQVYFDSAFYYTNKAHLIAKENSNLKLEAQTLFNKGIISSMLGKHEEAITHYLESKNVFVRLNNKSREGACYNNIGGSYFELGKYDIAIENYEKALKIAIESNDDIDIGIDYMNIGEAHFIQGRYQEAKEIMELALESLRKTKFNPPTVHLFYARTLSKLGDLEEAKKEALLSLQIAQKEEDLKYISEAAQLVADIFVVEKEFEQAFYYQQISNTNSSKLNAARESNEIEKLKLNFELSERNKELAYLAQRDRDQTIIYLLAGVGVLLLLVVIFRQRKIVKMTREIHAAQKRLVIKELDEREWKAENPNATGFDAALTHNKSDIP